MHFILLVTLPYTKVVSPTTTSIFFTYFHSNRDMFLYGLEATRLTQVSSKRGRLDATQSLRGAPNARKLTRDLSGRSASQMRLSRI